MKSNWPTNEQYEACMDYKIREIINRNGEEFYNKYFRNHRDDWNMLCASMDTLGDTSLATQNFIEKELGQKIGEKYLKLYGLLQAVFLQQDAIKFLFEIIKKNFDVKTAILGWDNYSRKNWDSLRGYRNLSSGHPIENKRFEKGKTKRALISRITISADEFQLLICDEKHVALEFQDVQVKDLVKMYLVETKIILSDIENFLKNYEF